ncbi:hypothetical protein [Methanohalobium sp.]|uniref:helix-turn-helix transcriptional regulator n=1 Tax=Methanohalobium sp. TaxID=2837493 RepID=UPI0025FC8BF8|nr:hypothetical protein [Methanohalobium sp.]
MVLLLIIPVNAETTATVYGEIYNWKTFEPVENAIVTVNSTPKQSIVAEYGVYTFSLSPGDYQITAKSYQNGTIAYRTQENITIKSGGNYSLDLLLTPVYDTNLLNDTESSQISESFENDSKLIDGKEDDNHLIIYLVPVIVFSLAALFFIVFKRFYSGQNDTVNELQPFADFQDPEQLLMDEDSLPDDLQKVFDVVKKSGGRITQKDLRNRLKYSEAKISLMISDLEERGYVEKFKKGRGNVVRIVDELNDNNE